MSPTPSHHRTRVVLALALVAVVAAFAPGCNEELIDPSDGAGFSDLDIRVDATGDIDLPDGPRCPVTVTHAGDLGASRVALATSFNGYSKTATPMVLDGGVWRADLELPAGHYPYKLVIDGVFEGDPPPDVYTHWDGGTENRDLAVPDCDRPRWDVRRAEIDAGGQLTVEVAFVPARDGEPLDAGSIAATIARAEVTPTVVDADGTEVITIRSAVEPGKRSVRLAAADAMGRRPEPETLWLPLWREDAPFDWRDATMYLVFVDRFRDSDASGSPVDGVPPRSNYRGGDLRGVIEQLEAGWFDELGVNALWLNPVYDNAEGGYPGSDAERLYAGYHGYWPIDSAKVEPRFGDAGASADDRLRELIDKAHARGMRVVFDTVFNHVHDDHPYCEEHPDWCAYTCVCGTDNCGWEGPGGRPRDCQFAPYLPDLDYRNHAIVRRQLRDTMAWAAELDVDAFRVDAAKHMDHVIMRTLSLSLRDTVEAWTGQHIYLIGETFVGGEGRDEINAYVAPWELDGQFDFPLMYGLRHVFAGGGSFRDLEGAVAASEAVYGEAIDLMSPFVGNHDVPRFATEIAGNDEGPWGDTPDPMAGGGEVVDQWDIINRMSLAFATVLTVRGVPLLYYGDEIGLAGSQDPDNRRMMQFPPGLSANQRELLERVRGLGQARRDIPALRRGARRELWIDDDLYVFARHAEGQGTAIVAMQKGTEPRTVQVQVPAEYGLEGATLRSYDSTREITVQGGAFTLTLDPWEYAIFAE